MNKFLLIITSLLLLSLNTDNNKWVIKQRGEIVSVDKLGKVYQITDNAVVKYNNKGEKISNYAILNNGEIASIDTRNPLQSLLFFKQQQEGIVLDNMLGESNKINFANYFEWIDLVCTSNRDNALWLYNISNQELIKTDINLNIISKTNNLAQILSLDLKPTQLTEVNETVFLFDKENGLILFDLFGNYKKKIALKNASKIYVDNNTVYYLVDNTIYNYNLISFDKQLVFETPNTIVDFCALNNTLIIQFEDNVSSFVITSQE